MRYDGQPRRATLDAIENEASQYRQAALNERGRDVLRYKTPTQRDHADGRTDSVVQIKIVTITRKHFNWMHLHWISRSMATFQSSSGSGGLELDRRQHRGWVYKTICNQFIFAILCIRYNIYANLFLSRRWRCILLCGQSKVEFIMNSLKLYLVYCCPTSQCVCCCWPISQLPISHATVQNYHYGHNIVLNCHP